MPSRPTLASPCSCSHTLFLHREGVEHAPCAVFSCECTAFTPPADSRWGDPTLSAEAVREKLAENGIGGDVRKKQVGGDHYAKHAIQPWDIWEEYGLNAFEGAVLKYLLRRKNDRVEDLKKARHTLDRLIEIEERKARE